MSDGSPGNNDGSNPNAARFVVSVVRPTWAATFGRTPVMLRQRDPRARATSWSNVTMPRLFVSARSMAADKVRTMGTAVTGADGTLPRNGFPLGDAGASDVGRES